jgi:hypothetical protein
MIYLSQSDTDTEKEISDFICSAIGSMAKRYELNPAMIVNCPSFRFPAHEQYGEEIWKIDLNATYTDDGSNRGYGKTIFKDDKTFIIIDSLILIVLIQSGYEYITSKHVIYHELGHWLNSILNPELQPEEQPSHKVSLWDCSRYLCSVMIDEYMANNYITFLFSKDECMKILHTNTLYADIENLYTNICDPFDLFNRLWNSPNAIFKNLFENIPFFEKTGNLKENETLKILNIKGLMAALDNSKPQFDIIYQYLVETFNIIVADYNSDNPPIIQKPIR